MIAMAKLVRISKATKTRNIARRQKHSRKGDGNHEHDSYYHHSYHLCELGCDLLAQRQQEEIGTEGARMPLEGAGVIQRSNSSQESSCAFFIASGAFCCIMLGDKTGGMENGD